MTIRNTATDAQALADALGVIADAVESVHLDELPDVWPMLTEHSQAVPTCSLDEWHTHLREYIAALEGLGADDAFLERILGARDGQVDNVWGWR